MGSLPPPIVIPSSSGSSKSRGGSRSRKPPLTPAQKAARAAADAAARAANPALAAAQALESANAAAARAAYHANNPWVTVQTDTHGNVVGLGTAYGPKPPKNALRYGGQPLTQNELSSMWTARYATVWEQYTGKVPTAADIVSTLKSGLSPYGLQTKLSQTKTFTSSPVYKSSAPGVQAVAQQVLGGAAPDSFVRQAIALGWDQSTVAAQLRKLPQYLQGPEFQTNQAQMNTVYKQIYGAPDANAQQAIRETAAAGWTTDQFASYLRSQPQYKTSVEYQAKATSFLDAMGLLLGSRAVLTPTTTTPAGGTAVPNVGVVPGKAAPLNPVLGLQATLPDNPGLAG